MEDEIAVEPESASEEIIEEVTEEVTEEVAEEVTEEPKAGEYVETDNPNLQKRFNKITAQTHQERARADKLQARLDQIEADNLAAQLNKPVPTEEQFDYDQERHEQAKAEHYRQQGIAQGQQAAMQQAQEAAQQAQAQEVHRNYSEKAVEFAKDKPDFRESIGRLTGMNPDLMRHIQTLPNGPEFAYELAQNMDLARQVNQAANAGDRGALGAGMQKVLSDLEHKPKNKKVTKAGKPVASPIQSGVGSSDKKYKYSSGATFE